MTCESSLKDEREEAMRMSGKSIPGRRESKCKCPGARGVWCVAATGTQCSWGREGDRRGPGGEVRGDEEAEGTGPLRSVRKHGFDSEGDGKPLEV